MIYRPNPRRQFLASVGAATLIGALDGCASADRRRTSTPQLELPPLRIAPDRISAITVCTRPFRAQGPRFETQRLADRTIIHNYGHGGSGWSLSWGYGYEAMQLALATGQREFGVIGCGAIGLTTAVLLARSGARVTIYAKDLPPFTRSSWASGVFTPDSRIALGQYVTPEFSRSWNERARYSYHTYQSLLGLADQPVEYLDSYSVDGGQDAVSGDGTGRNRPPFAQLQGQLLADLLPGSRAFQAGTHTLGAHELVRSTTLMFNLSAYTHLLMSDFRAAGGTIEVTEFASPGDLSRLPQKTLVHATGYGARALFGDESVIPVRGQLARTPPQEGIHYGLEYRDSYFVPRRDGFVFQVVGPDDYYGYGDDTTVPDRSEAIHVIQTIQSLFPPV
ncbi:MAG TPA: FAD-dependent oxidoreductase [Steroidobacteraceae bacterium]|jgi:glycine/D-amino acid oxidase-like deaminating enzyme